MDFADADKPSDDKLLESCIKKDKDAWDAFVEKYSKLILWAIRDRLIRFRYDFSDGDVEDIHQEVFVSLWSDNRLAQIKDRRKVAGWIVMVAGNAAIDYFRRMKRQMPPNAVSLFEETIVSEEGEGKILADLLPAQTANPGREFHLNEFRRMLETELDLLEPKKRIIVKLNLINGMKHREISEALNLPIDTVSAIIARTKEKLKEILKQKGIENF